MAFRVGRGRRGRGGRPIANAEVLEELRSPREEMVAMKEARRRDPVAGDVSEKLFDRAKLSYLSLYLAVQVHLTRFLLFGGLNTFPFT